jgi:hypothetical protein
MAKSSTPKMPPPARLATAVVATAAACLAISADTRAGTMTVEHCESTCSVSATGYLRRRGEGVELGGWIGVWVEVGPGRGGWGGGEANTCNTWRLTLGAWCWRSGLGARGRAHVAVVPSELRATITASSTVKRHHRSA